MVVAISCVEDFWRGNTETMTFKFFEYFDNSDPEAKPVADAEESLREIMGEKDSEKRLKIANSIIKDGKSDLGIAHVVVARASSDLADKEKHYRLALKNSTGHSYKSKRMSGDPLKADMLFGAITLEFADVLWRSSKMEAAIEMLQELQNNSEALWIGQDNLDSTVSALGTYLICAGRDAEARTVLEKDTVPFAHWYYLNALLRFRESGDCVVSRSALSAAFDESIVVADDLANSGEEDDAEHDISDWEEYYAQITLPAWKQTDGALAWLSEHMDSNPSMYGAEEVEDEVRYKKWQREMDLADSHMRRDDFKSAKRSFKTALREADSLNDGGDMFLLTAKILGSFLIEAGDSLDDLRSSLDKKIAWLDRQDSDDYESLCTSYLQFAKILDELDLEEQTKKCLKKALEFYEKSMEKGSRKLDYFYGSECLYLLACVLSKEENFEDAERHFAKLSALQGEFLGEKHLDLVEGLMGWRFCLHQLNRHEEEKRVYDRLKAIDVNFDADDEYRFVCEAVPVEAS